MQGLIHLYCGDGKGKTTAAVGLSVRAAGAGKRVLFAQFLKDGSSSELNVLRALQNVEVACCEQNFGFFRSMDEQTKAAARLTYSALLEDVMRKSADGVDLLVLDEAVAACNHGLIEEATLIDFLATSLKSRYRVKRRRSGRRLLPVHALLPKSGETINPNARSILNWKRR